MPDEDDQEEEIEEKKEEEPEEEPEEEEEEKPERKKAEKEARDLPPPRPRPTPRQSLSRFLMIWERQSKIMVEYQDVQFVPLKLMAYTMFFFVVIFTWLRIFVDERLIGQGNVYFAVPWSFNTNFHFAVLFPSWILLYSLLAIPFGQVVQRILKYFTFRQRLQAMGEITEFTPPEEEPAPDDPPRDEDSG